MRFRLFAAASVIIALYHLAALSIPAFARLTYGADYPTARHLFFIALALTVAYLFLVRPRWLIWPFLVVTAQVIYSHGGHILQVATHGGGTVWADLTVIALVLSALASLYSERRKSRPINR